MLTQNMALASFNGALLKRHLLLLTTLLLSSFRKPNFLSQSVSPLHRDHTTTKNHTSGKKTPAPIENESTSGKKRIGRIFTDATKRNERFFVVFVSNFWIFFSSQVCQVCLDLSLRL
jgi:hypothetical protein